MSRVRVPEGVPSSKNGNRRSYSCEKKSRPVGQAVKTAASHAANRSSILLRVTIFSSHNSIVGVDYGEGPPVPISNTVVKLTGADNTWLETAREDK